MSRIAKGALALVWLAGFLVSAGISVAAEKIECAVMKNGVKTTKMVASKEECLKENGKVVEHSAKPKTP